MNLENFRKDYLKVITESTDTDLKAYIRSIVEEVMKEEDDDDDGNSSIEDMIERTGGYVPHPSSIPRNKSYSDYKKVSAAAERIENKLSNDDYFDFIHGVPVGAGGLGGAMDRSKIIDKYKDGTPFKQDLQMVNDFLNWLKTSSFRGAFGKKQNSIKNI